MTYLKERTHDLRKEVDKVIKEVGSTANELVQFALKAKEYFLSNKNLSPLAKANLFQNIKENNPEWIAQTGKWSENAKQGLEEASERAKALKEQTTTIMKQRVEEASHFAKEQFDSVAEKAPFLKEWQSFFPETTAPAAPAQASTSPQTPIVTPSTPQVATPAKKAPVAKKAAPKKAATKSTATKKKATTKAKAKSPAKKRKAPAKAPKLSLDEQLAENRALFERFTSQAKKESMTYTAYAKKLGVQIKQVQRIKSEKATAFTPKLKKALDKALKEFEA